MSDWQRETRADYQRKGFASRSGYGRNPAFVIVDFINGFTDPTTPLGGDFAWEINATRQLLDAFRRGKLPVFYTTVAYAEDMHDAGVFAKKVPSLAILQQGSPMIEVDERIKPFAGRESSHQKICQRVFWYRPRPRPAVARRRYGSVGGLHDQRLHPRLRRRFTAIWIPHRGGARGCRRTARPDRMRRTCSTSMPSTAMSWTLPRRSIICARLAGRSISPPKRRMISIVGGRARNAAEHRIANTMADKPANTPRPQLSSVFDDMLAESKERFGELYRGGSSRAGAASADARPFATRTAPPARAATGFLAAKVDPQSAARAGSTSTSAPTGVTRSARKSAKATRRSFSASSPSAAIMQSEPNSAAPGLPAMRWQRPVVACVSSSAAPAPNTMSAKPSGAPRKPHYQTASISFKSIFAWLAAAAFRAEGLMSDGGAARQLPRDLALFRIFAAPVVTEGNRPGADAIVAPGRREAPAISDSLFGTPDQPPRSAGNTTTGSRSRRIWRLTPSFAFLSILRA